MKNKILVGFFWLVILSNISNTWAQNGYQDVKDLVSALFKVR